MWHDYKANKHEHSVVGNLLVSTPIFSPHLKNERRVFVYTPPSYDKGDKRYPVIYMQDGQNLFDRHTSYAGEWEVDETMEKLARFFRLEAIVVGIPNLGERRIHEYSPFKHRRIGGGQGDIYLKYMIETLKPQIDAEFRTLPDRANTGIFGASMGGLISLYGFLSRPEVFGFVGAMSPSLWFANRALLNYAQKANFVGGRIYIDAGTHERATRRKLSSVSRCFCEDSHQLFADLVAKGYRDGEDILYIEEEGGTHSEHAWAKRLPYALGFLLS